MKISFSQLENAKKDPKSFKKNNSSNSSLFNIFHYGYNQLIRDVVLRFHQNKLSIEEAKKDLLENAKVKFKSGAEKIMLERFYDYINCYQSLNVEIASIRHKIYLDLPSEYKKDFEISGIVYRVDMDLSNDGYIAWVFTSAQQNWKELLKLPLIQSAVAEGFELEYSDVKIGVYCFDDGTYEILHFDEHEINNAKKELCKVLDEVLLA